MKNKFVIVGILAVLLLAVVSTAVAQEEGGVYQVESSTYLNVRSRPNGEIIGRKSSGERVQVIGFEGDWAKIYYEGQNAYVSAKYIREVHQAERTAGGWTWPDFKGDYRWLVYVILGLSLISALCRKLQRDEEHIDDSSSVYVLFVLLQIVIYGVEFAYQVLEKKAVLWFCHPADVGWMWTIINFIIFGYVVYNQFMCLMLAVNSIRWNGYSSGFTLKWGLLYGIKYGGILAIIAGIFFTPALPFVIGGMGVCQLVQAVIIARSFAGKGTYGSMICCMITYLAGIAATFLILLYFMTLFIIVLIGYFLLSALANGSSSSSSRSGSDGLKRYVLDDGTELTQTFPTSACDFHDNNGHRWEHLPTGSFRRVD